MKLFFLLILSSLSSVHAQEAPAVPPAGQSSSTEVSDLVNKVLANYKSLDTYSSSGMIISNIETGSSKLEMTTTFSIKLKKPNLYLITWSQTGMPMGMTQAGTVWSDGTQPYLYMGVMKAYSKISDDALALGAATGISGGAACTIPSLFLPVMTDKVHLLPELKNPVIERSESVGSEDCYVLSGSSNVSKKETYWISKSRSLILKYERSLEPPAGGVTMPAMSDQDLEKALRATGQPVTDASRKQMRDMMTNAESTLKKSNLRGDSTEIHEDISTPALTASDFQFTPPNGTALKDSLMTPQAGFSTPIPTPATAGKSNGDSSYETVEAPVVQVFSANDGDNKFIAYLVKWKGSDVIVSDPLAKSNFKVGDTLKFLAQKINGNGFSTLNFTLVGG